MKQIYNITNNFQLRIILTVVVSFQFAAVITSSHNPLSYVAISQGEIK